MHDFHKNTAEALPERLHQLKGAVTKWCIWCRGNR